MSVLFLIDNIYLYKVRYTYFNFKHTHPVSTSGHDDYYAVVCVRAQLV